MHCDSSALAGLNDAGVTGAEVEKGKSLDYIRSDNETMWTEQEAKRVLPAAAKAGNKANKAREVETFIFLADADLRSELWSLPLFSSPRTRPQGEKRRIAQQFGKTLSASCCIGDF